MFFPVNQPFNTRHVGASEIVPIKEDNKGDNKTMIKTLAVCLAAMLPFGAFAANDALDVSKPASHGLLPKVPLSQVRFALHRDGCLGTCPAYRIEINGEGNVVYSGEYAVAVTGIHRYRIAPAQVAALMASMEKKGIWQARLAGSPLMQDASTITLTLQLGSETRRFVHDKIEGEGVDSLAEFESEIDHAADTGQWRHLRQSTLEKLKAEHFDFHSGEAGKILAGALGAGTVPARLIDEKAVIELIDLGAPLDIQPDSPFGLPHEPQASLIMALSHHLNATVDRLLAAGALNTDGKFDQTKIDAAFVAAIRSGKLDAVARFWDIAGKTPHPALTFAKNGEEMPVILALEMNIFDDGPSQRVEIAKWLIDHGCEFKAGKRGQALLDVAIEADDVELVRFALQIGMDVNTPNKYDEAPIQSSYSEEVTMVLLEAGPSDMQDQRERLHLRKRAEERDWPRVLAWLDAYRR